MKRPIALILEGFGWGAPDMRTGQGPAALIEALSPFLDDRFYIFYTDYHAPGSHYVYKLIPEKERGRHYMHVTRMAHNLSGLVMACLQDGAFPLVIGGDHSIAMGTWSGVRLANPAQDFGLLWFDAHMDINTTKTSLTQHPHGMPVSALLGIPETPWFGIGGISPKIRPEHLMQIGIRSFDPGEQQCINDHHIDVHYAHPSDTAEKLAQLMEIFKRKLPPATPYYGISIDVDVFDPSYAPGTGTTEPNGLDPAAVIPLLTNLVDDKYCICAEITEYNPEKDIGHKTRDLVFNLIKAMTNL